MPNWNDVLSSATGAIMKAQDQYLQFVRWSEEDQTYVGYCPDLFPAGGVCHGTTPVEAFTQLSEIVEDTVITAQSEGLPLPPPRTRPMPEVEETV
jgi:predicted RNase H-like HicB family nuclease